MSYSEIAGQPTLVEVRCKAKNGRCWTLIAALLSDGTVVEAGTERVLDRLDDESENVSIGPGCKYHRNSYRDRTGRPMKIGEQRIFVDRQPKKFCGFPGICEHCA